MKSAPLLAALAAMLEVVSVSGRHNHGTLHRPIKKDVGLSPVNHPNSDQCVCATSVLTWYGEATCKPR